MNCCNANGQCTQGADCAIRKQKVVNDAYYRCPKCCLLSKECKCFTYKGVHRCDICNGTFEVGEHYYSDCPASFVHVKCRFPKEQ